MFDLEEAVRGWKKDFRGQDAYEDGILADMELHLRDAYEAGRSAGLEEAEAFRAAAAQVGTASGIASEYRKNQAVGLNRRSPFRLSRFLPALVGNYFKVVYRKIRREKGYSFLNIAGLTAGMAAFLCLALYCRFERGYDQFHRNADRIFRVQNDQIYAARHIRSAACPPGLGPTMKKEFPEVADFVRLFNASGNFNIVSRAAGAPGDAGSGASDKIVSAYEKRIFFADPSFLEVFSFPLVRGEAITALREPDAVVLTESTARKYFGDDDPLRKVLTVTTRFGRNDYRVTGVCRNVPPDSHLRFDILLSYSGLEAVWPSLQDQTWASNGFLTYILLAPTSTSRSLEAKFPQLIAAYPLERPGVKREFRLQPLRAIHLTSRLRYEADVNGDRKTVVFLEIVGLFILVIAWVNFINLATARSLQRAKEVGVRKTVGAEKRQLAGQFLFESLFFNVVAFLLAITVFLTVLPAFGRLVGKPLSAVELGAGWIGVSVAILAGSLLSGAYPAFILSSFRPAFALRGLGRGISRGAAIRKGLVLFQFALAILLVASTLTVGRQLSFVRGQDLGADIGRTFVLKVPPADNSLSQGLLARDELAKLSGISDAAISTSVPGREYANSISGILRRGASRDEAQAVFVIDVDDRYFRLFGIPMLAGRTFFPGFAADESSVVLNEEAVKLLGFESPEKALQQNIDGYFGETAQIIGVVKNYHHKSLLDKIEPVLYAALPWARFGGTNYLSLKIREASLGPAIDSVGKSWKELFPGQPLEFSFLDEDFDGQYDAERRFGWVFGLSSLLAIAISCLGLFGLASYAAERKTCEIGIRKVFGASRTNIAALLAGEFVRWVLLANVIAWPATAIVMNRWLGRFAFRTTFSLWTLSLSAVLALAIALVTVSVKAVKSASANPVDALKYE